ncbi:MAG: hypothetical protein ACLQVD_19420, partial [Capsulimonadaceae bacterium]
SLRWNNFLLTYFRTIGMIGVTDQSAYYCAIDDALKILASGDHNEFESDLKKDPPPKADTVLFRTRYEAARLLERLHPTAPQVYCEHITRYRWGKPGGEEEENIEKYVFGYAVRGFHKRHHVADEWPPIAFMKVIREVDCKFQALASDVRQQLVRTIIRLAEFQELHSYGEFLQVNCSYALIRWLGNDSEELTKQVFELASSNKSLLANPPKPLKADSPNLDQVVRCNLFLALKVNEPQGVKLGRTTPYTIQIVKPNVRDFDGDDREGAGWTVEWNWKAEMNSLCGTLRSIRTK